MRKIILTAVFLFIALFACIMGPYNLFYEFNEEKALKQFIAEDKTFQGLEVIELDYRGSDTYYIQAKDDQKTRNFIVMNYHSSVMNGHWKVFEQTSAGHYY
ncbi:hypothetical protein [Rossellomorea aquimaris]|uniref:hypothetical protein n=1 Tax=Rossellomorea aquimaris TaxID=189382 RepID=UPI001CFF1739|nr:hypothetical protein [Rossellomorea aquimaris]